MKIGQYYTKDIKFGKERSDKENFVFVHNNYFFVRHSEYAIKKLVKELGLTSIYITRDKDWWSVYQHLTQEWVYTPRYH